MFAKSLQFMAVLLVTGLGSFLITKSTVLGIGHEYQCSVCHGAIDSGELSSKHIFIGEPGSELFIKIEELSSWITKDRYLASLHRDNQIRCGDCHVDGYEIGMDVQTATCLQCHGSYEDLAEMTKNMEMEEANPHKSHLGEVDCTVCHHAHQSSVSYCRECHVEFVDAIPGR